MSNIVQGAGLTPETPISGYAAEETPISGSVTQGPVIINDYVIDLNEVESGVQLTVRKGSEVQTALIPMGSGGGGVTSWNDLQDKPVEMSGSDTLTWDGNTDGRVSALGIFYKASDAVPTVEDFQKGGCVVLDGEEMPWGAGGFDASGVTPEGVLTTDGVIVVPPEAAGKPLESVDGLIVPEPGTYLIKDAGFYTSELQLNGYTGFNAQEKIAASHLYQPDWNQNDETKPDFVKNKPFGETTVAGDTLVWDGNTEGHVVVTNDALGISLVHVSDTVPTLDDIENGGAIHGSSGEESAEITFTADDLIVTDGVITHVNFAFVVVSEDNTSFVAVEQMPDQTTMLMPKKGVYFPNVPGEIVVDKFTIPGYTGFTRTEIKTIDTKYLPEHLQFGEEVGDTLVWDGSWTVEELVGEVFAPISDVVITKDDVRNGLTFDFGDTFVLSAEEAQAYFVEEGYANFDLVLVVVPYDNYEAEIEEGLSVIFPQAGMYSAVELPKLTITCPGCGKFVNVKKLDGKYMPESDAPSMVVLYEWYDKGSGVYRICKDIGHTEILTQPDLYRLATSNVYAVFRDGNGCYPAILQYGTPFEGGVAAYHTIDESGNTDTHVAYTAEYTPE